MTITLQTVTDLLRQPGQTFSIEASKAPDHPNGSGLRWLMLHLLAMGIVVAVLAFFLLPGEDSLVLTALYALVMSGGYVIYFGGMLTYILVSTIVLAQIFGLNDKAGTPAYLMMIFLGPLFLLKSIISAILVFPSLLGGFFEVALVLSVITCYQIYLTRYALTAVTAASVRKAWMVALLPYLPLFVLLGWLVISLDNHTWM